MSQSEIDSLKKRILDKYERLGVEDTFTFKCDQNIPCFTRCCGDVNIFLTPYDVLRLKNKLGITSDEFLDKYTVSPITKDLKFPVILLKMDPENEKRCYFVTDQGCGVYDDRPWPCRMYPIGMAQSEGEDGKSGEEFYFIMAEDVCEGLGEGKKWTIKEWVMNQGVELYNIYGDPYKKLTLHPYFQQGYDLPPKKMEMFHMALYDLDRFRRFLFESDFFNKFDVDEDRIHKMKTSDTELLLFGYSWLYFALFGEPTMRLKPEVKAQYQDKVDELKEKMEQDKDNNG